MFAAERAAQGAGGAGRSQTLQGPVKGAGVLWTHQATLQIVVTAALAAIILVTGRCQD